MTRRLAPWLLLLVLIGCTGCASGKEARAAARAVLAEVVQYERLIDRKIIAEQAYYAAREKSLADAIERGRANAKRIDVAVSGNRGADDFIRRDGLTAANVVDFVAAFVRGQEEALQETYRKRQELRTLFAESLAPLEVDKAALQRLRKTLEAMQVAPSEGKQLKAFYDFFKATRDEYDKLRKEDEKEAK